jgi:hypothetical protein
MPTDKSKKTPATGRTAARLDDDDDEPTPRASTKSTKKPATGRTAARLDDDDDEPTPRASTKSTKKPATARTAATLDDDDDEPTPRASTKSTKKPATARTATTLDEGFASFLRKHGLTGDAVLAILTGFDVNSLSDLKMTKEDPDLFAQLKKKFQGRPIVIKTLDKLPVEAIDNAIFYSQKPEREAEAETLADFLIEHDVLADGEESDKEKLLRLLRSGGVTSLGTLKSIKESGKSDAKLKALTAKITQWSQEAGSSFESITFAMVAKASRGRASEASEELKDFIAKKGLPAGTEAELVEFGITTLEDLKDVKEDDTRLDQLKAKLGSAGIPGATEKIGRIKVADIEQEIAEAHLPEAKDASQRSAQLADAIDKVEELRQKVEDAAGTEFDAVKSEVETQYTSVLRTINSVSGAEFKRANADALASKTKLSELLSATITDARQAKGILDGVEKKPRTVAKIIAAQGMLSGFLITPDKPIRKFAELIKLPENAEDLKKDPGAHRDYRHTYNGRETTSFAASTAEECSRTLAVAAETSGAVFVGSGIAAVSAAAKYADSQKESSENQQFQSDTETTCGEIRYKYVPKQVVQFNQDEIRLSDEARKRLDTIVKLPAGQQTEEIEAFYGKYGSHFFLRYSLGGRYKFKATGTASTGTSKGQLKAAVAKATEWAASASGSYAGMGGAVTAAASVKGEQSGASAEGNRFEKSYEGADVLVETDILGGTGIGAPQDIWQQSLRYNSTWEVIDRDVPIPVWNLVKDDKSLNDDIKRLAAVLEEVWVRQVFRNAVEYSHPLLYNYLNEHTDIITGAKLDAAVKKLEAQPPSAKQLKAEPEFNVVVAMKTSGSAQHPRAIAGSTETGLKLIGGGAIVDYGQGPDGLAPGRGQGILLTGSYPQGNSWVASAKDHKHPNAGTVTAYAIYLSDPDDLWEVTMVVSPKTDARSNRPEATAKLPDGYALTGGGALLDWGGPGMLLTACCPQFVDGQYTAWTAKGKDHLESDSGTATAWVFGVRARNDGKTTPSAISTCNSQGSLPTLEQGATSSKEVIVGGGAAVTYSGAGGLLTRCGPSSDHKKWNAQAKDHDIYDGSLDLTMWVISRNGRLVNVSK